MKVTYIERSFLDKFRCVDRMKTRIFDKKWEYGGLTYFKLGQFTVFTIETNLIVDITE